MSVPKTGPFVVKVQLSIATNVGYQTVLIYNRNRSVMWQDRAPDAIKEVMGADAKAFFIAHLEPDGQLMLDERAPWQEW